MMVEFDVFMAATLPAGLPIFPLSTLCHRASTRTRWRLAATPMTLAISKHPPTGVRQMATKAKRFRICVEGATTDGRAITREWISQMASGYDPKVYGARINLEHIKSVLPESSFRAYGDVTACYAEEITEGALAGKLALFAEIDPTPDLVSMNKARQKVYTSV